MRKDKKEEKKKRIRRDKPYLLINDTNDDFSTCMVAWLIYINTYEMKLREVKVKERRK